MSESEFWIVALGLGALGLGLIEMLGRMGL